MSADIPFGFDESLLDDFFVEADSHLLTIRQAIHQLENTISHAQADPGSTEELFQNFHSFKGISAIAGLRTAEAVAHSCEDYLRLHKSGKVQWSEEGLGILNRATQALEQIVGAFRAHEPSPGCETLLADLKRLSEETSDQTALASRGATSGAGTRGDLSVALATARAQGLAVLRCGFVPSHELKARGVDVTSVRAALAQLGEVLKATPIIQGAGAIKFEFLVAAREMPGDMRAWADKNVMIETMAAGEDPVGIAPKPETIDASHNPFLAPSHFVRVNLKHLDDLMRITGEMVIHRSRLDAQLAQSRAGKSQVDIGAVQDVSRNLGQSFKRLRDAVMRIRLVPVAEIFARMPFVVRDLARQTDKKVRLKLGGEDTAVDKYLIERLKDPLLHLVRNAFSHGVESVKDRRQNSKPEEATIELAASSVGDSVTIRVRDDGRGIHFKEIRERAAKLGLEVPDAPDNAMILKILCSSGFSTRDNADRAAGRGIGMAVVESTVRELGGSLSLDSEPGQGTQFTLRFPQTLALAEVLIIQAGGQTCAVPQSFVREVLHAQAEDVQTVNGIEAIPYRNGVLPIVKLTDVFKLEKSMRRRHCVLVIASERGSVGLLTDTILGQREVLVRALRDPLIQVPGIAGATELGDGKPVLILDGTALTDGSVRPVEGHEGLRGTTLFTVER